MEEVLLNKILVKVEQIGTDLKEFKDEMHEFKDEMYEFRDDMYKFKDEMYEFRDEIYAFRDEMYEFRDEIYAFRDEMYEFKEEVYKLFDQYSKETAIEINQLAEVISKKMNELRNEIRKHVDLNNRDHKIYEAQIEKLQISNQYLEAKIHI